MKTTVLSTLVIMLGWFIPQPCDSCTSIMLEHAGRLLVGKNYDFNLDQCLISINKRGVGKVAFAGANESIVPAQWTSKYGSISFNPWGREFAFSGMNEAGLVASTNGLENTVYPPKGNRPATYALQWLQFQLDNFATVRQVLDNIPKLGIVQSNPDGPRLHYLFGDAAGDCAVVEFLEGKPHVYTGTSLPMRVMTNIPYAASVAFWQHGTPPAENPFHAKERFVTAATALQNAAPGSTASGLDFAFDILQQTTLGETTMVDGQAIRSVFATEWSIVYDIRALKVHFRTFLNRDIRSIDLRKFDLTCATPVSVFDVQRNLAGDVTEQFADYTPLLNKRLIAVAYRMIPQLRRLAGHTEKIVAYPESTVCRH